MDVVIRLGVRIEMHWPLFSIGTLQLNTSRKFDYFLFVRVGFWRQKFATGVKNRRQFSGAGFWSVCHGHKPRVLIRWTVELSVWQINWFPVPVSGTSQSQNVVWCRT